jgi:pilus assembly protein Flp/PilA
MMSLFRRFWRFVTDKNGPTAVEYAVMLGLIIATLTLVISSIGDKSANMYTNVSTELDAASGGGGKKKSLLTKICG